MIWENTKQILEQYAKELVRTYKENLINDDKVATGNLVNSINFIIENGANSISVSLSMEDYWKYVENGRKAGKFPPIDRILDWIRVKPVIPDERTGKLPTENQLAFLIARKIANEGIEPGNQLNDSRKQLYNEWMAKIEEAITKDVSENVDIIFSQFLYKD